MRFAWKKNVFQVSFYETKHFSNVVCYYFMNNVILYNYFNPETRPVDESNIQVNGTE